ncbi:recombination protein RecR [Candidatus Amesbacteria bacterium RIFCSPLOWO2_02_FULL_48_11]|uniref:Recombination protein RecR n=2 Tax=Candidatus Amesiibacteriota TaxID=1752730 RepID=A0A1F4Z8S2_9BACT|nr:MAG: Recombination protein RecR [Candidatus Amesbacteria bacterium GW2011_GWA2_47_11]OGC91314.1 MAG: recombination protein RecR [Candidatus Amesbacteria bacterium RBG_19FT_COMBO_48_16]OGC96110.1 MAG: recombination protein RecR [Candidatus Amesbacteria bacterium RIFCSPHIGHO2_02_FULL_48_21]OGC97680.1 MAG: recombination protein RecR [Candidatus Amesbacteria bacterium RBG_16_48_31]OGC99931.1 MAG: recombination protein RecR [Candidatus Amesbacteria bacterium RIFCSPHIGHO2_01_FULL_48_75]OGD02732.1
MRVARAVNNLIEAFERLPGIGPKTAARLTYYLLHVPQGELDRFAGALSALKKDTVECSRCHNIAENDPCDICSDPGRDKTMICVVEQPLDVVALERGNGYRGGYHVLHGVIDPLHNIGPDEIRIRELLVRLRTFDSAAGFGEVKEVILALNPNMEGEATCMYILRQVKSQDAKVKVTRLAHGLPVGADIEYADDVTLSRALEGRREY